MKTTKRILGIALATLLSTAGGFAQSTTTPTGTTTSGTKPTTATTTSGTTAGTPTTGTGSTTTPPTTTGTMPAKPGKASPHTPNEHASDTAKAVQALLLQFEAKRDQAIAERKALIDKLQAAKTDAERQAILTQLRAETQTEKDQQRALGKQIRDELKTLRDQRKSGGG